MPHKHVRQKDDDPSRYDLPPSVKARPLPVGKAAQTVFTTNDEAEKSRNKRKRARQGDDDTPKAFARMMAWQQQRTPGEKRRTGLDQGEPKRPAKKQKQTPRQTQTQKPKQAPKSSNDTAPSDEEKPQPQQQSQKQQKTQTQQPAPKILPNESLADFSARVDQSLPISNISRKASANAKTLPGQKERTTKTERRMKKMYAAWRVEDEKRKERVEEERERAEESEDERDAEFGQPTKPSVSRNTARGNADNADDNDDNNNQPKRKKNGKKSRKPRVIGETSYDDRDPWAALAFKKGAKPAGLHDIAQAPPEFKTLPREKFKVRNLNGAMAQVADVPGSAGSLKRREELGETRREIIERYRAMMGRTGGL